MKDKEILKGLFSLLSHREDHGSSSLLLDHFKRPGKPSGGSLLSDKGLFEYLKNACREVASEFPGSIVFDRDFDLPGCSRRIGFHNLNVADGGAWSVLRFIDKYPDADIICSVSNFHASVLKTGFEIYYLEGKESLSLLDISSYLAFDISYYTDLLELWQAAGCVRMLCDLNSSVSRTSVILEIIRDPDLWVV